jgi:hypothetical protein
MPSTPVHRSPRQRRPSQTSSSNSVRSDALVRGVLESKVEGYRENLRRTGKERVSCVVSRRVLEIVELLNVIVLVRIPDVERKLARGRIWLASCISWHSLLYESRPLAEVHSSTFPYGKGSENFIRDRSIG